MTKSKRETTASDPAVDPSTATSPIAEAGARAPGDEPEDVRRYAPDPFAIAGDYQAGVKLLESRRFRRSEIEFVEGKPSPSVIDKLKEDGFRWSPQEKLWIHPIGTRDAMATRVEAERTYKAIVELIREEKGLVSPERAF